MAQRSPVSNLKEQDYGKWVEGQSTKALEEEILRLERARPSFQRRSSRWERLREAFREITRTEEKWNLMVQKEVEEEARASATMREATGTGRALAQVGIYPAKYKAIATAFVRQTFPMLPIRSEPRMMGWYLQCIEDMQIEMTHQINVVERELDPILFT